MTYLDIRTSSRVNDFHKYRFEKIVFKVKRQGTNKDNNLKI